MKKNIKQSWLLSLLVAMMIIQPLMPTIVQAINSQLDDYYEVVTPEIIEIDGDDYFFVLDVVARLSIIEVDGRYLIDSKTILN